MHLGPATGICSDGCFCDKCGTAVPPSSLRHPQRLRPCCLGQCPRIGDQCRTCQSFPGLTCGQFCPFLSLIAFVNTHLNKLNLEVTELETQFADGVYLVLLMGLLEGYFVPLHNFYLTPDSFDQKVHNVSFAFELMLEGGLMKPKARPEDVVNLDLKSTLRVLYNLYNKYKTAQ